MSEVRVIRDNDGKEDMIFGFDINGEQVEACTVHQEFLDIAGVPVENRKQVMQGIAQMFIGMLKPFMELAG
jgi:hypothetical protein